VTAWSDRLAAFYHWTARQSLDVAVQIALDTRLGWGVLTRWSTADGFEDAYEEFVDRVARLRARASGVRS
jgi:hypothetical protein